MGKTLYEKVFERHTVRQLPSGHYQLLMGLHLIHEVTSPQAFAMLRERGLSVLYPHRTFATVDHIVPTDGQMRPYADPQAEQMMLELEKNLAGSNIRFFSPSEGTQGIVHVIGPEQGLTQPGMTICCGDSHTSTHGAFGAIAFGIGSSQVRDVLATQCLAIEKLKVRRIDVDGSLQAGVYAKDVILAIIRKLGVKGGVGYAYEYGGQVFDRFTMDERMTVCNMSIEGGARCGYVNPDKTAYDYLRGRAYAPSDESWEAAQAYWESIKTDQDVSYDDRVRIDGRDIAPMVTWGITPGQSVAVDEQLPTVNSFAEDERSLVDQAYSYMDFKEGNPISGTKIDVAFVGSCTNGRLSDIEEVTQFVRKTKTKVAPHVKALIVPGSQHVRDAMRERGYDDILRDAGFDVRDPGCSMCLAMNPDRLSGDQICASSSNRNFKGRQGSPRGRTLLMSPVMVAAAALAGEVVDVRDRCLSPAEMA